MSDSFYENLQRTKQKKVEKARQVKIDAAQQRSDSFAKYKTARKSVEQDIVQYTRNGGDFWIDTSDGREIMQLVELAKETGKKSQCRIDLLLSLRGITKHV